MKISAKTNVRQSEAGKRLQDMFDYYSVKPRGWTNEPLLLNPLTEEQKKAMHEAFDWYAKKAKLNR